MKNKQTPFLDFYMQCMETGKLPNNGLCHTFGRNRIFNLVDPEDGGHETYWAYSEKGYKDINNSVWYRFTPLRQTVVLLCAAINNEL